MKSVNNFNTQKYNMSVNTQIYVTIGNSYTYLCSYRTQKDEIYQVPESKTNIKVKIHFLNRISFMLKQFLQRNRKYCRFKR